MFGPSTLDVLRQANAACGHAVQTVHRRVTCNNGSNGGGQDCTITAAGTRCRLSLSSIHGCPCDSCKSSASPHPVVSRRTARRKLQPCRRDWDSPRRACQWRLPWANGTLCCCRNRSSEPDSQTRTWLHQPRPCAANCSGLTSLTVKDMPDTMPAGTIRRGRCDRAAATRRRCFGMHDCFYRRLVAFVYVCTRKPLTAITGDIEAVLRTET